jgi:hypothetical protein
MEIWQDIVDQQMIKSTPSWTVGGIDEFSWGCHEPGSISISTK